VGKGSTPAQWENKHLQKEEKKSALQNNLNMWLISAQREQGVTWQHF
jgi:hypothetical protein